MPRGGVPLMIIGQGADRKVCHALEGGGGGFSDVWVGPVIRDVMLDWHWTSGEHLKSFVAPHGGAPIRAMAHQEFCQGDPQCIWPTLNYRSLNSQYASLAKLCTIKCLFKNVNHYLIKNVWCVHRTLKCWYKYGSWYFSLPLRWNL